jgi:hypothetical protein
VISYESCCHRCGVTLLYFKPKAYGAQRFLNGGYWELDQLGAPVRRHFCEKQYRAEQVPLDFVPAKVRSDVRTVRANVRNDVRTPTGVSLTEELGL